MSIGYAAFAALVIAATAIGLVGMFLVAAAILGRWMES